MKKLVFILAMAVIGSVVFGQARTNAEKPQFLPVQSEILTKATGWAYNESLGEWIDYDNMISSDKGYKVQITALLGTPYMFSREDQNFISIQTRMFTYKGINYYLLIVIKWVGSYTYPSIYEGWSYDEDMTGYIFSIDEFEKLKNINGLATLKAIGGAGGGKGRKYNDAAWLDSIQSIFIGGVVKQSGDSFDKLQKASEELQQILNMYYDIPESSKRTDEPEETGYIFPVLKSEEGNIRFCIPSYVGRSDKNPFYGSPFNFNKGYFEITPEEFSKITIMNKQ
jgi:hypothetical protein